MFPSADDQPYESHMWRTSDDRTFRPEWPGGARCAASLTVHVDAQTVWPALGHATLNNLTLGEFGARVGVWRVLELLARRDLKASFYIPGQTVETYPGIARACAEAGHELGYHGYTHLRSDAGWTGSGWDKEQERETIDRTLDLIERVSGERPRGHCFEHSPHTIDLLLEREFLYSNSHQADDIPYWWFRDGEPTGLLELPFDWIMSDSTAYLHLLAPWIGQPRSPDEAFEIWKAEFDGAYAEGRYFLLTIHPQWSGRSSRIRALGRLLEYIGSHKDVWWAPMDDVARYWHDSYPPSAAATVEHEGVDKAP
ncbi:MAG: peptidoglycan-N-acetylglucosamine deacetylase [Solirubrobacteraceae bacterium]|nr:peptidoglycan-N-acetylglucosamine deacetylase [Solirubrobacteraceae bacterium]